MNPKFNVEPLCDIHQAGKRGRKAEIETMTILKTVLENLAERIAATQGGRITPNGLMPYLPVSLEMIRHHLDEMVDNSVVFANDAYGIRTYEFGELVGGEKQEMPEHMCLRCGEDTNENQAMRMCFACQDALGRELLKAAENTAWPADAIWQHELLYITASVDGPIRIADVAGRSRMTLKQVKAKLIELVKGGFAKQVMEYAERNATYEFPPIDYPREAFLRHDKFIRLHPSSLRDEYEMRIIKTLGALVVIAIICMGLALGARIPFPLLLVGGAVAGVIAAWKILSNKTPIEPGRIRDK